MGHQVLNGIDQNRDPNIDYGAAGPAYDQSLSNARVPYEPVHDINVLANATSNSEESFLIQAQKKSLEVITERQSEFSNTMGTFARPSQRSKQSKNHSSNTKHTIVTYPYLPAPMPPSALPRFKS